MIENILTIQSLTKGFDRRIVNHRGDSENEHYSLIDELSLNVQRGQTVALIGGNGVGKTTLFNIISGLIKPDSGSILYQINNKATQLIGLPPHRIAGLGIGRLFQDNHIFPELSVLDNMLVADFDSSDEKPWINLFGDKKAKEVEAQKIEKVKEVFESLFHGENQLWQQKETLTKDLSYGQKRLLGLARLYMHDYTIMLLDEPTSGVNPDIINQIKKLILSFAAKNQTVLFIEHNLEVVRELAQVYLFMDEGRIIRTGNPDDVFFHNRLEESKLEK
jgi:ABC-type branched-subunit amino acid transport system ATPase component